MSSVGIFGAGRLPLPAGACKIESPAALLERRWQLLLVTEEGCAALRAERTLVCACETLLVQGDCGGDILAQIRAERVVSYGVCSHNSLTFSSMGEGQRVLCIQRELLRPDGSLVERQELPLAEEFRAMEDEAVFAVMGLRLLLENPPPCGLRLPAE